MKYEVHVSRHLIPHAHSCVVTTLATQERPRFPLRLNTNHSGRHLAKPGKPNRFKIGSRFGYEVSALSAAAHAVITGRYGNGCHARR
jgi:hypothetical protein